MKEFGIGLLGFGTVGAGVVDGLTQNGALMAERTGIRPVLRRIADLDIESDRGVEVDPAILTTDASAVIDADDIDVVVELIGGTGVAKTLTEQALARGKPVVTANKALLAKHGAELFALAHQHGTEIYFGASVGGGIPVIRAVREGLVSNRIEWMYGILNGTCNYILSKMENDGADFGDVLKEAQALGFAEADPSLDVDGFDTAHKAALLATLAYGFHVPFDAIPVEGIRDLSGQDIAYAHDLGYRIKLLAEIRRFGDSEVDVRVQPTLVPLSHMLASVGGVFNAILVHGDMTGDTLYYGKGAGREPTASTVLSDIADVMKNLAAGGPRQFSGPESDRASRSLMDPGAVSVRYYLRLMVMDNPGVLADITSILGKHAISIASVLQKETNAGDYVPVVIVTHEATARDVEQALAGIAGLAAVRDDIIRLRIADA